jgi:hypothetical protein
MSTTKIQDLPTPKPSERESSSTHKSTDGPLTVLFYIVALYISFLCSGVFEEKLYKGTYISDSAGGNKIKFSHPLLAILCNSFVAYIISSAVLVKM